MCYFHTKFEVDPIKDTPKIRFLSVLWLGPILTSTFDLDPYHFVWWLLTPWYSCMQTMMFLRQKTKKLKKLSFYVMTSRNDVITSIFFCWFGKHSSIPFIWGTTRYGTVWFLRFQNWPSGKQITTGSETHEGQGRSAPKINQLSGSSYATFTPSLELIW
jgi:hypothetical protein